MLLKQPFPQVPPQPIAAPPIRFLRLEPKTRTQIHSSGVEDDLAQAKIAWKRYRATRERDAVYDYLGAVFKVVRRWRKEHRAKASSHQALKLAGRTNRVRNVEPFAIVILCTSDPHKLDPKTRSKLSRVLRYADKFKPGTERLADFVKRQGGINECVAQWSKVGDKDRHHESRRSPLK
jgi:hypothetical protein